MANELNLNSNQETFTQLPNQILDAFISNSLTSSAKSILACICRKTYGFHKTKDGIPLTQFEGFTGYSRPTINKELGLLVKSGLLVKTTGNAITSNIWQINTSNTNQCLVNYALLVKSKSTTTFNTQNIYQNKVSKLKENNFSSQEKEPQKIKKSQYSTAWAIRQILSLRGDKAKFENGKVYISIGGDWAEINNPWGYLKTLQSKASLTLDPPEPEKPTTTNAQDKSFADKAWEAALEMSANAKKGVQK